jgi:small subunit ribosomal protein S15
VARFVSFQIKKQSFMYLNPEKKQEIFGKFGKSNTDTGSPESQIALFSYRINHLTGHLKLNHKDYSTEHALRIIIGKRRRLLDYLKEKDIEKYRALIKELGIRR